MSDTIVVMGMIGDTGAHISLAFRHGCTPVETGELLQKAKDTIRPLIPFACMLDGLIMVGFNNELDAFRVHIEDYNTRSILKKFYLTEQRRKMGENIFPIWLPHVTLKQPERRAQMLSIEKAGRDFVIERFIVRTLETQTVLYDSKNDVSE